MKKTTKLISLILSAVLVTGILPVSALATDTKYSVTIFTTAEGYSTTTNMGGTISGAGNYTAGDTVTLTATPASGYCAIGWSAVDSNTEPFNNLYLEGIPLTVSREMEITFTMPAQDVYVTGNFNTHKYTAYTANSDGITHDVHCYYCGDVQTASEPHIDETTHPGYAGADGLCDKCGADMPAITLPAPANPRWDTTNGTVAVWDAVDGATSYIVELWKKDIISLHLLSHVVSDTSFEYYLTTLSAGSYYFTVRAVTENIKSNEATSNDIMITSGGTPILINGSSERVDYIAGTAFIVGREDIADGSISEVDMTPIAVTTTLTNEQATELIAEWIASWEGYSSVDTYKNYIRPQLEDYSLADLEVILNNIDRGMWPNDFIADVVIEEIEARKVTSLIIDPNYIDSNADKVTVNFGGTQAEMNNDALQKILVNLGDGDNVKISVKDVGAEALPETLTEQGPYGGSEAAIDKSIFKATGIENIEDRLKTLGLINGNTDSSVTEDEFEYLYHYLTTDELMTLKNELNESVHFEHHQNAVNWLTEMIERDNIQMPVTAENIMATGGIFSEEVIRSWTVFYDPAEWYPTIGQLRTFDMSLEQLVRFLKYMKTLCQAETSTETLAQYDALLSWLEDAIAQKELEQENANITSMTVYGLKKNAALTDKQIQILHDMGLQNMDNPSIGQIKKLNLTLEQLELLYAEIDRASAEELNPAYQGEYDILLKWLEKAIAEKEQEAKNTPTYINVSGTPDGINPLFIGAVDVNIGAVKADGTTTPIAIKADRSDACAWSTNFDSAWLEEKIAEMKNAMPDGMKATSIRAYKVLENDTLEARGVKVVQNADGTLTLLSAFSNGNSTYVFLLMPGYEITLNENYSGGATSTLQTGADGKLTSLPSPTRSGYTFLGWYDAQSGGNEITVDTAFTEPTEIFAQWSKNSTGGGGGTTTKYTVTFETDGGSEIEAVKVTRNSKVAKPENPTNGSAIFRGWYTDSECTEEYDFDSLVTKSFTLYAKWSYGSVTPPAWVNPFDDVFITDWFYPNVRYVFQNGLMKGTSETTFAPNLEITRGMFVTVLWRMENEPVVNYLMQFKDVDEAEYYGEAVRWAASENIVKGFTSERFAPNEPITREQLAAIMLRYANYKGIGPVGAWAIRLDYTDLAEVSDWAMEGVMYCTLKGIMQGKGDNLFAPKDNTTRAETAAILQRFIESNAE